MPSRAEFKLHIRCINCQEDSVRLLCVPDVEDAPSDIDELVGSEFLNSQRFTCRTCQGPIGTITAVTLPQKRRAAA